MYIIQNKKGGLYIGFTTNLSKRIWYHNNQFSQYTKLKGPWDLVWYCVFNREKDALNFERYLKTHSGRMFIEKRLFISGEI
ncbi:MAG: GIY-YIG nuclease family protein [Candidatus Omnitrophica bacterium]|nr:GIY-YIG nuclease family protein [Candidatus Omnitrophota bacterium]